MDELHKIIEGTAHFFIEELKTTYAECKLQITHCTNGEICVAGFRTIDTLSLSSICHKYGRNFIVPLNTNHKTLKLIFSICPLVVKPPAYHTVNTPPFLAVHTSVPHTIEATQEHIVALTKGSITSTVEVNHTVTVTLQIASLALSTLESIHALPVVANVTLFPSKLVIVLLKDHNSQSSLLYLKRHRPELFAPCVNNKPKSTACKTTSDSKPMRRRPTQTKKSGSTRWRLW